MKPLPQISDGELEIMKIVWEQAPISTNDITSQLVESTQWSPKTIQTMIKRLTTKGALSYEKQGRVFVYTPMVWEHEYKDHKSSAFLDRYYDGDITALVSSFIEPGKLSADEINTLKSLLIKGKK